MVEKLFNMEILYSIFSVETYARDDRGNEVTNATKRKMKKKHLHSMISQRAPQREKKHVVKKREKKIDIF